MVMGKPIMLLRYGRVIMHGLLHRMWLMLTVMLIWPHRVRRHRTRHSKVGGRRVVTVGGHSHLLTGMRCSAEIRMDRRWRLMMIVRTHVGVDVRRVIALERGEQRHVWMHPMSHIVTSGGVVRLMMLLHLMHIVHVGHSRHVGDLLVLGRFLGRRQSLFTFPTRQSLLWPAHHRRRHGWLMHLRKVLHS